MDAATMIVAALTAGITEAAKGVVSDSVKSTYNKLKSLLQRHFQGKADAEVVLAKVQEQPDVWKEPLKKVIVETRMDHNTEVLNLARELLSLTNPQQATIGKYNNHIAGNVKGLVQGENANVTMNFEDE